MANTTDALEFSVGLSLVADKMVAGGNTDVFLRFLEYVAQAVAETHGRQYTDPAVRYQIFAMRGKVKLSDDAKKLILALVESQL